MNQKKSPFVRFMLILLSVLTAVPFTAAMQGCSGGGNTEAQTSQTGETAADTKADTAAGTEAESTGEETAAVQAPEISLSTEAYTFELEAYARELLEKTRSEMTNENAGVAYEYLGKKQISYLWPFSVLLEAVSAVYECDTDDEEIRDYYVKCLDKFLPRYLSSNKKYRAYASSTSDGDRYYDDNEWIVIEFVRAYKLLGDEAYLTYAKELAEYCYSGWVTSCGGIMWQEGGDSCNTCSNGPCAVLSCMLYEVTGEQYYLDWALKIYGWTRDNLLAEDGNYFDNMKIKTGKVDEAKYSYNTGTMIVSGVMLYKLTGDSEYLAQARQSASGGFDYFLKKAGDRYIVKNNHPWFNSWLLEGFIELFEADCSEDATDEYISGFYKALVNAADKANGGVYVGKSWNSAADSEVELIHQAGTVRAMAQLARFVEKYSK